MGKLSFEWDKDVHNRDILLARKARGKITVAELQEELSKNCNYHGGWAILFKAQEDTYQGWGDIDEPKGDILELYHVADWCDCPVCAAVFCGIEYCPHCGERIKSEVTP